MGRSMDETIFTLALAGLLATLPACSESGAQDPTDDGGVMSSEAGHFEGTFDFDPDPSVTGDNDVHAMLTTTGGEAVVGATLTVEPWMPSMGHGSATTPTAEDMGEGHYHIASIDFTMPGSWEVRIDIDSEHGDDRFVLTREVQ